MYLKQRNIVDNRNNLNLYEYFTSGSQVYEINSGLFGRKLSYIMICDLCRERQMKMDKKGFEQFVSEEKVGYE